VQNSHQSVDGNSQHEPVLDQSSCTQPIFQVMFSYMYSYVVAKHQILKSLASTLCVYHPGQSQTVCACILS